jgi:hypothetical protein
MERVSSMIPTEYPPHAVSPPVAAVAILVDPARIVVANANFNLERHAFGQVVPVAIPSFPFSYAVDGAAIKRHLAIRTDTLPFLFVSERAQPLTARPWCLWPRNGPGAGMTIELHPDLRRKLVCAIDVA